PGTSRLARWSWAETCKPPPRVRIAITWSSSNGTEPRTKRAQRSRWIAASVDAVSVPRNNASYHAARREGSRHQLAHATPSRGFGATGRDPAVALLQSSAHPHHAATSPARWAARSPAAGAGGAAAPAAGDRELPIEGERGADRARHGPGRAGAGHAAR